MEIIGLKNSPEESGSEAKGPELKITDLRSGVRDANRVNVFVDGEFCFSLDVAQVVDYRLKIGKILTPAEVSELKHASAFGKLYSSTLEWVLMRPRSIEETREHLQNKLFKLRIDNKRRTETKEKMKTDPEFREKARKLKIRTREREEFTSDDIENVIKKLVEKKYLDDQKFAEWFIENRFSRKGVSRARLRQELAKKGIEKNLVEELFSESSRDEAGEIRKVILKRGGKTEPQKLLAYLVRHGFGYEMSREMVEKYTESPEEFSKED